MPTRRPFTLQLLGAVLLCGLAGFANGADFFRLDADCNWAAKNKTADLKKGLCENAKIVFLSDKALLVVVAQDDGKTVKYGTVYPRSDGGEKMFSLTQSVDLSHVLGLHCKIDPTKYTAFADWHTLYISALCKNKEQADVHALIRSVVYSEKIIHTPPGFLVYTNIPGNSHIFGLGVGYVQDEDLVYNARIVEFNSKKTLTVLIRDLNSINESEPFFLIYGHTVENIQQSGLDKDKGVVFAVYKNKGMPIKFYTLTNARGAKRQNFESCEVERKTSDKSIFLCYEGKRVTADKMDGVYTWRTEKILEELLDEDLPIKCGITEADRDFEACRQKIAIKQRWTVVLFAMAALEFLVILTTLVIFAACICHRRRKVRRHHRKRGKGKRKGTSTAKSKASKTSSKFSSTSSSTANSKDKKTKKSIDKKGVTNSRDMH